MNGPTLSLEVLMEIELLFLTLSHYSHVSISLSPVSFVYRVEEKVKPVGTLCAASIFVSVTR